MLKEMWNGCLPPEPGLPDSDGIGMRRTTACCPLWPAGMRPWPLVTHGSLLPSQEEAIGGDCIEASQNKLYIHGLALHIMYTPDDWPTHDVHTRKLTSTRVNTQTQVNTGI